MSIVERAIKKLQASPQPEAPERPVSAAVVRDVAVAEQELPEAPKRVVDIDKDALRAMELLPPLDFERQIASQYQQIKRPLVAAALGKSASPVAKGHLIMLASALPGEGKTFTSINLALSMSLEKDIDVLLIDADVAKPHITRIFGLEQERGLLDLLADASLHPQSLILPTSIPGLSLLPAGQQVGNATELLASTRMEQVVAQLGAGNTRRFVIFDSPPLLLSTESRALVPAVGQVVLVVRADVTAQQAVLETLDIIGDAKPVSLILNQSHEPTAGNYYGYGQYGSSGTPAASA
jgi:exopolysaccharide/PEP-CTERM locus tyrosine autokinase